MSATPSANPGTPSISQGGSSTQFAKPEVAPFVNKGLVLKTDPASLKPGEFQILTNMTSVQEGALTVRNGSQRITDTSDYNSGDTVNVIHSIAKLHGTNPDARYIGSAGNIYRSTTAIPASGTAMPFTKVATGVASGSAAFPEQRWTGIRYNAGTVGQPWEFFACPSAMLKDNSTLSALWNWGIVRPVQPAIAALDNITILPSASQVISGNARVDTTITSFTGTAPGLLVVTPASMAEIQVGTLLNINFGFELVSVLATTSTTFTAYFPSTPTDGWQISCGQESVTAPTQFSTITVSTIDASFNGVSTDGYSTADPVHVAIALSDASTLLDLRFRVLLNSSTSDYYEKAIAPSSIQSQVSLTTTPVATLTTVAQQVNLGIYGPYSSINEEAADAAPVTLSPTSPITNVNIVWDELDIPKNTFIPVGLAGTGSFNWKYVTGFQVVYTVSSGATPTLYLSSIYFKGGYGPNGLSTNATVPIQPYNYVFSYYNPLTGDESSPSQININGVTPNYQQVSVLLYGTADAQITGNSSIKIYRAGGSFADDYYRFIGFATNPGHAATTIFYDSVADITIAGNEQANFDNDPPVLSTLPQPFIATISSIVSGGAGKMTVLDLNLPSGVTDLGDVLTLGSTTYLSAGNSGNETNDETVYVVDTKATDGSLADNQLRVFTQYTHYVGDYVEVDAITGQPCNLGCAAFDSLFVAGDTNNPHILYKSKTGAPAAFPVIELQTGIADQIPVGSPSNPIMAVTEYGGQIICLNLSNIYVVTIFAGAMQSPVEAPAQRGLVGNFAWCKADNEIWYVSYDGVYSWSGGYSFKRSEKIDPLFKGFTIGPYLPIDTTNLQYSTMSYFRNEIRFVYVDTNGDYGTLRYNVIYDRWDIDVYYDSLVANEVTAPTAQYTETDTGILLAARSFTVSSTLWAFLYVVDSGSSDGWTTSATTDGAAILYAAKGAAYELGQPALDKQYSDIVLELLNDTISGNVPTLTLSCFYNFASTPNSTDTFSISSASGAGRRRLPLSLQNGFGMAAYALEIELNGATVVPVTFYSLTFNYIPLNEIQVGRAYDWDDLGYPYDKRLYELTIEYFVTTEQSISLLLDTMTGIAAGQTVTQGVQTFTLSPPAGTFTGPQRVQATFAMNDAVIVKKIRLRPSVSATPFKTWAYRFAFEQYPPDMTYQTEWSNYGSPYEKYAQQAVFEVNTNNVAATVALYADGAGSAAATFSITSTTEDRIRLITLPPNTIGKIFRFVITPGSGGCFQLFKQDIVTVPADRGPVFHTFDWDNMGYPYDKLLKELTIEYNTAGGGSPVSTTIYADTMTGINGGTINTQALSFVLNQSGRALQTFPIAYGTFVKQIRLYPATDNIYFQEWKPKWDFDKYPADITLFTEWNDFGWPCEKIARNLLIEVNTGGVAASIQLQADGANAGSPISITTTEIDRRRVIALSSELIGRNFRLLNTPGSGGSFQLFNWTLDVVREPCAVLYYDSYETDFGYDGYKFIKQMWLWYQSQGAMQMTIYVDGFTEFYQVSLPEQQYRDVLRMYFPAINSSVLNKSKHYRIQITSSNPFKLYAGSVIEWGAFGADQRAAYQQFPLTAEQQLPVAGVQVA